MKLPAATSSTVSRRPCSSTRRRPRRHGDSSLAAGPSALRLPAERAGWAPGGVLAYSKICTHAGCAIALYRTPLFPPTSSKPAMVCPCHYSTFDPASGGTVIFGPAGRPLPQLPLYVAGDGVLRAAGNFSGPVGPSWRDVREHPT
jgi:ubiquinol-cytochrome c reductase iron-sulfur subunit